MKIIDLQAGFCYNKVMDELGLRHILAASGADALFLEQDFLRRYVTGFYSTDGYVVADGKGCSFFADPRYFEAASAQLAGSFVRVEPGAFEAAVARAQGHKTLGVPFPFISRAACARLEERAFALTDCMPALKEAMKVKSADEIAKIARACEIAEDGLNATFPRLKEGMTEREAAAVLEYEMRMRGADGTSFETIVAFGAGSSVPHHETGDTKLKFGDVVLIDYGCKVEGYCSDCTRTFLFGDDGRHEDFKTHYALVLKAHEQVKAELVSGMTGRQADEIARSIFRQAGLDKFFTHSLGHGIGLQIHEYPVLSPRGEEVLTDGMVFSDEPGLYFEGRYGIRIEDSVYLKDGKAVSFMRKLPRDLIIL